MPTAPALVDVDCNLWHKDLRPLLSSSRKDEPRDFAAILKEDAIEKANIVALLSPSSTVAEAATGLSSLRKPSSFPVEIKSTVGVHPYHVNDVSTTSMSEQLDIAKQLLQEYNTHCVAVGECGLDASDGFPPLNDQIPWFRAQIELAQDLQLPLFVHERLAFAETMELLKDCTVPVIIHCFTGTTEECRAYIEAGYSVSLSGYICKPMGDSTRQCLTQGLIPLERLMIETDAPYLGFDGCRDLYLSKHADAVAALSSKKRKRLIGNTYPNLPSALPVVLEAVSRAINEGRVAREEESVTLDQIALQTSRNANQFFKFGLSEEQLMQGRSVDAEDVSR